MREDTRAFLSCKWNEPFIIGTLHKSIPTLMLMWLCILSNYLMLKFDTVYYLYLLTVLGGLGCFFFAMLTLLIQVQCPQKNALSTSSNWFRFPPSPRIHINPPHFFLSYLSIKKNKIPGHIRHPLLPTEEKLPLPLQSTAGHGNESLALPCCSFSSGEL